MSPTRKPLFGKPDLEPDLTSDRVDSEMRRRTRRSFVVAAITSAVGYAGFRWLKTRPAVEGLPKPLRGLLRFNDRVSEKLFNPNRRIPQLPSSAITPRGPRLNGDIGLGTVIDQNDWRLHIGGTDLAFTLADLRALPEVTQVTPLNCIEGWTTVARWTGVRLSDFTDRFFPRGRQNSFVGLSTPSGDYYVGLDAPSAFHPQTLLCYTINGEPLTAQHGAPLRLLIPTKYGIKNLKRIGHLHYSNERPADYWAEQGYDWYAGF